MKISLGILEAHKFPFKFKESAFVTAIGVSSISAGSASRYMGRTSGPRRWQTQKAFEKRHKCSDLQAENSTVIFLLVAAAWILY
jgi:hypothetical protein